MEHRKRRIDFRLYLITDRKLFGSSDAFFGAVEQALKGGVRALQLREKDLGKRDLLDMAIRMRDLTHKHGAKLFINDRVDVALAVDADGVHLGVSSIPPAAARKVGGPKLLIGVSTHGIDEAGTAEKDGADFITLGPIYETPSKMKYGAPLGPGILARAKRQLSVPYFAIGGFNRERAVEAMKMGACGIALISGIFGATDIERETKEFMRLLT